MLWYPWLVNFGMYYHGSYRLFLLSQKSGYPCKLTSLGPLHPGLSTDVRINPGLTRYMSPCSESSAFSLSLCVNPLTGDLEERKQLCNVVHSSLLLPSSAPAHVHQENSLGRPHNLTSVYFLRSHVTFWQVSFSAWFGCRKILPIFRTHCVLLSLPRTNVAYCLD